MTDACSDVLALLQRLEAAPESTAFLRVGGAALTATAFARAVRRAAGGLLALGMRPGDRLAVHLHRCPEEAVALLAAMVAGGIAVPIHQKLKDDQVAHVLADSSPFAVVTSATKGALLQDPPRVLAGRRVLFVDAPPRGVEGEPFAALDAAADLAHAGPRTPAILLYTSGSTGLQKGVVQDHGNLALGAALVAGYLGLTAADHILALLPFGFDYGLNQLLSAMHARCRITAADHLGLGELRELLRQARPTGLAGVPSLWHEVARGLAQGSLTADDAASLRYATNSGGRLRLDDLRTLRERLPRLQVFSMYGLTEAFRSAYLPPAEIDAHPDSFGKALPGVELLLVDPASGRVLEGPATGELVHAGALVAQGYWQRPADTARTFRPDPRGRPGTVVYSGDLVRRDAQGYHSFVGRRDAMLKVAGHRISPDEIVQGAAGAPGVGELAAFGLDGGADCHRIVLCAAGDPGDAELPSRLLRHCRARLPAYMVPAVVRILPALPHTPNGKIDLVRLRAEVAECTGSP